MARLLSEIPALSVHLMWFRVWWAMSDKFMFSLLYRLPCFCFLFYLLIVSIYSLFKTFYLYSVLSLSTCKILPCYVSIIPLFLVSWFHVLPGFMYFTCLFDLHLWIAFYWSCLPVSWPLRGTLTMITGLSLINLIQSLCTCILPFTVTWYSFEKPYYTKLIIGIHTQ